MKNSEICNYADDNSLTVADADLDKIIAKLETDIDILNTWVKNNGMLLNEDKCHFMIIEPSWNTRKKIERIKLRNETIEETNIAKLLGITFDNKLTMNDHIKIICKQASSKLPLLGLATEIYKTLNNLNPIFMREIFSSKTHDAKSKLPEPSHCSIRT